MSYSAEASRFGRRPVKVVEIDLDYCSHSYGVAPCAASIGTTGLDRCYNTRKTCQDPANYAPAAKTYRFADAVLGTKGVDFHYLASLRSVDMAPTKIEPMKGIGQRATVTVTLQDEPLHDSFSDKYVRLRSYDSGKQGTFWGKLIARNPFYQGRLMRVRSGYLEADGTFDWANFQTQLFVLDSIEGPDSSGSVKVVAKDLLKLADDAKAQAPALSTGALTATMTDVAVSFSVGAGQGAAYPASGTVAIGSELMTFTRVADAFAVTRGTDETVTGAHDAGAAVQLCLRYTNQKVVDVVYDLLTTYGNVAAGYITKADWDAEGDDWLEDYLVTTVIVKPTGVTKLLTDLSVQGLFYVWWDEVLQKILFKVVRPAAFGTITDVTDDEGLVENSFSVREIPVDRVSQVWVYYGKRDPTMDDKEESFLKVYQRVDADAGSSQEYGEIRVKKIFAYWLPSTGDAEAVLLAFRTLSSLRDNPKLYTLSFDAKDGSVRTGDIVRLDSKLVQGPDGANLKTDLQVLTVKEKVAGSVMTYTLQPSFFNGRYGYVTPNGVANYLSATVEEQNIYGYVSPNSGIFSDGAAAYKII